MFVAAFTINLYAGGNDVLIAGQLSFEHLRLFEKIEQRTQHVPKMEVMDGAGEQFMFPVFKWNL